MRNIMNRKIFALFALTAGMHLAVHASENVNTTENRVMVPTY
nr:IncF plasmid conjugative transfer protein TrbC [Escherichia coli O25b:H4-ST131]